VRDRDTAVNDVETLMSGYKRKRLTAMMTGAAAAPPAAGVLLFSCLGRGRALFNEANFDSRMAHISTGVPVAGVCVCVYEGGRGGTCIY
jgi:small ligand-binding sensory domain FIST